MNTQNGKSRESLWKDYHLARDLETRNKLVESYISLVKYNADRIKAKLPDFIDSGDLESAGFFGLIDAVEAFDYSRGVKFETYCVPRIRGAILDELRKMDWVPRLVRSHITKYKEVKSYLSKNSDSGYIPSPEDIAKYFGVDLEEGQKIYLDGKAPVACFKRMAPKARGEKEFERSYIPDDELSDEKAITPERELSKNDGFNDLILCLNDVEQIVVTLYHRDDYTMLQIGEVLGLCESRVSQMHSTALLKIKDSLSL